MISEVFLGDCMDFIDLYSDKTFTIAIVDPPYGINAGNMQMGTNVNRNEKGQYPGVSTATKIKGRLYGGSGKLKNRALNTMDCDWDVNPPNEEYFRELIRVSQNQIIFGGNYFPLPPTRCVVCWNKLQPWENFSQWEMAWTSYDKPAVMITHSNTGGGNQEIKIHATQKPVAIYKELLRRFAKPGDIIFDSHMGSQSLRIACYDMGFDFYGCEINKEFFESGCHRFDEHRRKKEEIKEFGFAKTELTKTNPLLF